MSDLFKKVCDGLEKLSKNTGHLIMCDLHEEDISANSKVREYAMKTNIAADSFRLVRNYKVEEHLKGIIVSTEGQGDFYIEKIEGSTGLVRSSMVEGIESDFKLFMDFNESLTDYLQNIRDIERSANFNWQNKDVYFITEESFNEYIEQSAPKIKVMERVGIQDS